MAHTILRARATVPEGFLRSSLSALALRQARWRKHTRFSPCFTAFSIGLSIVAIAEFDQMVGRNGKRL
jgi:hypothetical protein